MTYKPDVKLVWCNHCKVVTPTLCGQCLRARQNQPMSAEERYDRVYLVHAGDGDRRTCGHEGQMPECLDCRHEGGRRLGHVEAGAFLTWDEVKAELQQKAQTYLIWSHEHAAWWAPDRQGYVRGWLVAGRYTFAEAAAIVVPHVPPGEEVAVLESCAARFQYELAKARYDEQLALWKAGGSVGQPPGRPVPPHTPGRVG